MPTYDFPGVYIEEQTGPGVIAGVGTSTAGFIGPAKRGPILEPVRVSSYDDFLRVYAAADPATGSFQPYITSPRWFYMAHAVRGFYENGGRQAYIVRIGTGTAKAWEVKNQVTPKADVVFRLQALREGKDGNSINASVTEPAHATGAAGVPAVKGSSKAPKVNDKVVEVDAPEQFRAGDYVTKDGTKTDGGRARITAIAGNQLTLDKAVTGLANDDTLRIANFDRSQQPTLRLAGTAGLFPGSVVKIEGRNADDTGAETDWAVVESVDAAGFVTFAANPASTKIFCLAATDPPKITSYEFDLKIDGETFKNLSLHPLHPGNVFSAVKSEIVRVLGPVGPPQGTGVNALRVSSTLTSTDGKDDDPGQLDATNFEAGLAALAKIDDVNLVCIPDAADRGDWKSIQQAMILHCQKLKDRFAILDSQPRLDPAGVEKQRKDVESAGGYAALYYPWLEVRDPTSKVVPPKTMYIPPSGHLAGVFARTDQERGVHKAPANTDVRGILGLERRLSDFEQGPLNLQGINVLRIFPGSNSVIVWGARTTVDKNITDWIYVNVRRLMLYIEESIEEGIRFAVFEPNNLPLWKALKRTISLFLTQVWRDGGLFGDSPDKAFYVRIDEALNPPSVRAIGRLYIEIGVAVVRPAEFIIVRIGLWDGGGEVQEG